MQLFRFSVFNFFGVVTKLTGVRKPWCASDVIQVKPQCGGEGGCRDGIGSVAGVVFGFGPARSAALRTNKKAEMVGSVGNFKAGPFWCNPFDVVPDFLKNVFVGLAPSGTATHFLGLSARPEMDSKILKLRWIVGILCRASSSLISIFVAAVPIHQP